MKTEDRAWINKIISLKALEEHSGLTSACFTGVAGGNLAGSSIVESKDNFAVRKQIVDNWARQICLLGIF